MTTTYTLSNVRKTQGRDFNFFQKLSVVSSSFGSTSLDGASPDMFIPFVTKGVSFLNEGTGIIEVSFNGTTVHDELNTSTIGSKFLLYNSRVVSLIWFRVQSGSSPSIISVRAWAE